MKQIRNLNFSQLNDAAHAKWSLAKLSIGIEVDERSTIIWKRKIVGYEWNPEGIPLDDEHVISHHLDTAAGENNSVVGAHLVVYCAFM